MEARDIPWDIDGDAAQALRFEAAPRPAAAEARRIVVVGAGPIGLSLAIDLAQRGQSVLLLDNDDRLSAGSRAICFSKRCLEVWDRLGVGQVMVDKGVSWQVGRVFHGERQVYQFDLLPEEGHQRPAFINLQQYYAEAWLLRRAAELPGIEIRWKHEVVAVAPSADGPVALQVDTPEGRYDLAADWVLACDGSRSGVRKAMGLESKGRVFRDRFLIADLKMTGVDFPAERWFWFDPPFHRGYSTLLHRQPDGVWRIDWQLGWDADPDREKQPERIRMRVDEMMRQALGRTVPFELVWASVYTFACLRMDRFRHGRVVFAGDSAHGVSPFGARGANSGVQDAENLAWKLDAVLRGQAPDTLLDTYASEREYGADENLLNSTRATDFITPKSDVSRVFRDATLALARHHGFARRLVNSGRLSVPAVLDGSPLNTPDARGDRFDAAAPRPGTVAPDAPVAGAGEPWLLRHLGGERFTLLHFGPAPAELRALDGLTLLEVGEGCATADPQGLAARRYDARAGTAYLIRPDQHVCARWREPDAERVAAAWRRAMGRP